MSNELINFEYKGVPDPDFKLRYISISKYEGDWQSHPHTHQFSELFYVISGKGVFYIENDTVSVCADDLIIINPHIEHTEKTMSNDPILIPKTLLPQKDTATIIMVPPKHTLLIFPRL